MPLRAARLICLTCSAEQAEKEHQATLVLDVNAKQVGQLYREWYSIADVIHVGPGAAHTDEWTGHHRPRE